MPDTIDLAQALIKCPSVTPDDEGALDVVQNVLEPLGFTCHRLPFEEQGTEPVDNLYARLGEGGPHFCFAGHTDVVPVGDHKAWRYPPFDAQIHDGILYGRGAEDMKGAVAAMLVATTRFVEKQNNFKGSLSFLITGDEEATGINGTRKVLQWMEQHGEKMDACLVGEPTNPTELGQMVKIGRRGSLSARLTVKGTQGHVAYPHLADNPVRRMIDILSQLQGRTLDKGTEFFPPSNLEVTSIDVGNTADNVIPAEARAMFNIRFNDQHTGAELQQWITSVCEEAGGDYDFQCRIGGEAFLTEPGTLSDLVSASVEAVTGSKPELSTTGGTSDARFIKDYCPVVEFGTTGRTPHKVNECVAVADLEKLTDIYEQVLERYFISS